MRCAILKGEKNIELGNIEEPKADGEKVLIAVKKTGICGSDIHYWDQGSPEGLVMGHEFCGIVIDSGSREDLNSGDRVTALPISPCGECEACLKGNPQFCIHTWDKAVGLSLDNPGGFTQKIKVRPDMVYKVPDELRDEEVAMVEPTAVGLHAVLLADIKVGEKVLVVGGGIIGLVSAMFAKMEGASFVAISETNPKRGNKAVELGVADKFFNPMDEDFNQKILENAPSGFDKVIECCGNAAAVTSALTTVKTGGKVILVGVSLNPIEIPTAVAVLHELTIQGAIAYTKEEFKACIDLMADKKIDVLKFLDCVVPLNKTQEAFEKLTSSENGAIKIIVDPNK